MNCPHCRLAIHPEPLLILIGEDKDAGWVLVRVLCPGCRRFILHLNSGLADHKEGKFIGLYSRRSSGLIYPKGHGREPAPKEVPPAIAAEYEEACVVLPDSARASAALSRRCLQSVLRTAAGVKPGDLATEIDQVLKTLPTHLAESIDAVRWIGNFAAHPIKSQHTGEIVDVELGEAEWNLDVLEGLFDFYFVQPAILKKKRAALEKKLADAGKPPLKGA